MQEKDGIMIDKEWDYDGYCWTRQVGFLLVYIDDCLYGYLRQDFHGLTMQTGGTEYKTLRSAKSSLMKSAIRVCKTANGFNF